MSDVPGREDTQDPAAWAREVATVVDPLLADVWSFAWTHEDVPEEGDGDAPLAVFLRMAYLQGYRDALEEPVRGELFERLGVAVPGPVAEIKKPSATRGRRRPGSSRSSDS